MPALENIIFHRYYEIHQNLHAPCFFGPMDMYAIVMHMLYRYSHTEFF